jgi:hypothetical protein
MSSQLYWFIARASGIMSWALLTTSVIWGLLLSTKVLGKKPRPNWLLDLHRFLGGTAAIFVGVHVAALVADSFVHIGPSEILVPLASAYRPAAVAWGVVSLYLLVAIELTSLARKHLPKRVWHGIHLASFPLFAMATIHALTAGTDSANVLLRMAIVSASVGVVGLTALRLVQATEEKPPPRTRPVPARSRPHWPDAPTTRPPTAPVYAPPFGPRP